MFMSNLLPHISIQTLIEVCVPHDHPMSYIGAFSRSLQKPEYHILQTSHTTSVDMSYFTTTAGSYMPIEYLPEFDFNFTDLSTFDENFLMDSLTFDVATGFEPVSPLLHPTDNTAWFAELPVVDPLEEEMKDLARKANARGPEAVPYLEIIDVEETILNHIKKAAQWYVEHGPAPRTLEERWKCPHDVDAIIFLIYLQVIFFGDTSLTPWQITFYTELVNPEQYRICPLCQMYESPWCQNVVPKY